MFRYNNSTKFLLIISISLFLLLLLLPRMITDSDFIVSSAASAQNKGQIVILTAVLEDQGDPERWKSLIQPAIEELRKRHSNLDIQINYTTYPYSQAKPQMLTAISNQTHVDLISLDQIWLGEFAERGLLTNLTERAERWGRLSEWYEANLDGNIYNNTIYGIWAWTDVRGIWYWKDLLQEADVDPNLLKTWNGYMASAKKLNSILRPHGIEGIHLTGASHSPDIWYPYLWILLS
jgi:multiple sugar transport system substrate-binding protein